MRIINVKKKYNYWFLIQGLCSIADGLVRIVSFGFLYSSLQYEFVKWELSNRKNN